MSKACTLMVAILFLGVVSARTLAQEAGGRVLPGTELLTMEGDIASQLVDGVAVGDRVVVHAATLPWMPSPMPGVERRMLDRIGGEVAGDHTLGTEVDGLLPAAALSVDGGAGHRLWQPCPHPRVADHVGGVLPHLGDAATDHVVDALDVDAGALDQLRQREAQQVGGVPSRDLALAAADRGPECVDDDGFTHGA